MICLKFECDTLASVAAGNKQENERCRRTRNRSLKSSNFKLEIIIIDKKARRGSCDVLVRKLKNFFLSNNKHFEKVFHFFIVTRDMAWMVEIVSPTLDPYSFWYYSRIIDKSSYTRCRCTPFVSYMLVLPPQTDWLIGQQHVKYSLRWLNLTLVRHGNWNNPKLSTTGEITQHKSRHFSDFSQCPTRHTARSYVLRGYCLHSFSQSSYELLLSPACF